MVKYLLLSLGIHLSFFMMLSPSPHQLISDKHKTDKTYFKIHSSKRLSPHSKQRIKHSIKQPHIPTKSTIKSSSSAPTKQSNQHNIETSVHTKSNIQNGLTVVSLPLKYPNQAIKKHLQGSVIINISFKNGVITNFKIIKSSGYQILDRAVITALKKAKLKKGSTSSSNMNVFFKFKL